MAGVSDASGSKDFALARFNPDGTLDETFGAGGLVTEDMRSLTADIIHGIAVQPDGKIVVAGVTYEDVATIDPHGDFMVARYLPDGSPRPDLRDRRCHDHRFRRRAPTTSPTPSSSSPTARSSSAGTATPADGPGVLFGADQLALARYLPNGLLDPAFGQGGQGRLRRRQPRRADPGPGPGPGRESPRRRLRQRRDAAATCSSPACAPTARWPTGSGTRRRASRSTTSAPTPSGSPASSSSRTGRSWPAARRRWPTTPTSPSSATSADGLPGPGVRPGRRGELRFPGPGGPGPGRGSPARRENRGRRPERGGLRAGPLQRFLTRATARSLNEKSQFLAYGDLVHHLMRSHRQTRHANVVDTSAESNSLLTCTFPREPPFLRSG